MRVLIVDDSTVMRRAIEKYLDDLSVTVVGQAGDGAAALDLYQREKPDLVTMDITMPHMDGLVCLEEMRKLDPSARVIIITALADQATALLALKKGASSFVNKPFTREDIRAAFQEAMEQSA